MKRMTRVARSIRSALGLSAGAFVLAGAPVSALAAIVCDNPSIAVPQNIDGVYINLVTGLTGTSGSAVPGWDFDPYASSSNTLLSFYAATGAGYVSSGGVISALGAGTTVGASSTYLAGVQSSETAMGTYRAGVTGATYLGFRFVESGNTYYGWLDVTTAAPNGFPMTLNGYCYEDSGASIKAGDIGVVGGDDYCSSSAIPIPASIDGAYINLASGAVGTGGSSVPGWDINLYQTGANALYFFWPSNPVGTSGGVSTATIYDALGAGAPIGPGQTYITNSGGGGAAPFVHWQTMQTGKYLGLRLYNEATSSINYGWLQLDTGASGGFPATINKYCIRPGGEATSAGEARVGIIFRDGFEL